MGMGANTANWVTRNYADSHFMFTSHHIWVVHLFVPIKEIKYLHIVNSLYSVSMSQLSSDEYIYYLLDADCSNS